MSRPVTILMSFLFCWQSGGFAQEILQRRFEAISSPVRISFIAPSTGISESVYMKVIPPGSAVSERVRLNVNSPASPVTESAFASIDQKKTQEPLVVTEQKNDANKSKGGASGGEKNGIAKTDQNLKNNANTGLPGTTELKVKEQKSSGLPGVIDQKNSADKSKEPVMGADKSVLNTGTNLKSNTTTGLTNKTEILVKEQVSPNPLVVNEIANNATGKGTVGTSTTMTNLELVSRPSKSTPENLVPESSGIPKYFALLIGVSNYLYASSQLSNLEEPVRDVRKLEKVLVQKYEFQPANVKVLIDPKRGEIIDELDQFARLLTAKDNLLIFFAGHGVWDDKAQVGYWLPSDARSDRRADWIPNSTLQDYIGGIFSKHTLLISDACFSGSIFKVRGTDLGLSDFGISKLYQLPSRKAMTSGNLKNVPDKSKFLEYLVKRLEENEDRFLSARILFDRIYVAVINNTNSVPLYGVVHSTGDEGGDFIFIRKKE